MTTNQVLYSDLALPPGEYLLEVLQEKGIRPTELAQVLSCSTLALNEMIQGKVPITTEIAWQLERFLGVPATLWIGLQAEYDFISERSRPSQPRLRRVA
jgi:HTH-type transcriptional regulator/antitoxin HigA